MFRNEQEIREVIVSTRIVALMRGLAPDVCLHLVEAYAKGGIRAVEVTFDQSCPESWSETAVAIRAIADRFGQELYVGAGTVLNAEQLSMAEDAGGSFIVSPVVNCGLIRESVRRSMPAIAGAMTPSEAVAAHEAGASFVKVFPAHVLGPEYVRAISAPLGHIPFLAFQGITPENLRDFLDAGCVGAGVGGCLADRELIASGAWDRIGAIASNFINIAKENK